MAHEQAVKGLKASAESALMAAEGQIVAAIPAAEPAMVEAASLAATAPAGAPYQVLHRTLLQPAAPPPAASLHGGLPLAGAWGSTGVSVPVSVAAPRPAPAPSPCYGWCGGAPPPPAGAASGGAAVGRVATSPAAMQYRLATAELLAFPARLVRAHQLAREAEVSLLRAEAAVSTGTPSPAAYDKVRAATGALTAAEQGVTDVEAQLAGKAEAVVAAAKDALLPMPELPAAPPLPAKGSVDPIAALDACRARYAVALVGAQLASTEELAAEKALMEAEAKAAASVSPSPAILAVVQKASEREAAAGKASLAAEAAVKAAEEAVLAAMPAAEVAIQALASAATAAAGRI